MSVLRHSVVYAFKAALKQTPSYLSQGASGRCGSSALLTEAAVIKKILQHLGLQVLLDAIEASTVIPQNLTLARLAHTVKLQKCLDAARIGGFVVRPIGGNDDVIITHSLNRVLQDRLIRINRDIAVTSKIFTGRHL